MLYNYLVRYPFSNSGKNFLKEKNIDLLAVDSATLDKAGIFLLRTISLPLKDKEKYWINYAKIQDERIALFYVKLFPVCRILLKIMDYTPISQEFAVHFQQQFVYYINHVFDNDEFDTIIKDISPELHYEQNSEKYYLKLTDYLSYDLGSDHKLEYANLENGLVYFSRSEVITLCSIILKKRILKDLPITVEKLPKLFLEYAKYIKNKVISESSNSTYTLIDKPESKNFPPCFLVIYNKIMSSQKLTHIENFVLAVFLANIGYSYNEILDIFKHAPNYDEKIAGYQIKTLMEKKYSVLNCDSMASKGLCVNKCGIKHPLQYFKLKKGDKNE